MIRIFSSAFAILCMLACYAGFSMNSSLYRLPEYPATDTFRIRLETSRMNDIALLYIRDTARSTDSIGVVLGKAFMELTDYARSKSLQPGKFLTWYHTSQPPWVMEIAVEVPRLLVDAGGRIKQPSRAEIDGKGDRTGAAATGLSYAGRRHRRRNPVSETALASLKDYRIDRKSVRPIVAASCTSRRGCSLCRGIAHR